jgi:uncharacterized protein
LNGPPILYQLIDNKLDEVEQYLQAGGNPNIKLEYEYKFTPQRPDMSHYMSHSAELETKIAQLWVERVIKSEVTPLEIAIPRLYYNMVDLLAKYRADFTQTLFEAVLTDDERMIKLVVCHGAKLDYIDNVGKSAYWVATFGKKYKALQILKDIGLNVEKYGGESLRTAASCGDLIAAKFLLENGVDINFHKPDMVFPYASTAIIEAARHNDMVMVEFLVNRGADIRLADNNGDRPYTCALKNKNTSMAEYIKRLEPGDWHNEQEKLKQLKNYKMPTSLIEFLQDKNLRMSIPDGEFVKYIVFYALTDVVEMKLKGLEYLSLVAETDTYDFMLLWSKKNHKICYLDIEHEVLIEFGSWDEFVLHASYYVNGVFDGTFDWNKKK